MIRRHTSFTPGLNTFLSKVATPAVLLLGILILVYFNFNSAYKNAQLETQQIGNLINFSHGPFGYRFQENMGTNRPALRYLSTNIMSYAEWSSTVAVDGDAQELWNTDHGYDVDYSKNQVVNAIKGSGWQLIEIVSLVDDHTVTVTFDFTVHTLTYPAPSLYEFNIAHIVTGSQWYNYSSSEGKFLAEEISGTSTSTTDLTNPDVMGKFSLVAKGVDAPTPTIDIQNKSTIITPDKRSITVAQSFFTDYTVKNPTPDRLITLGTETLTYNNGQKISGNPLTNSTVDLPTGDQP